MNRRTRRDEMGPGPRVPPRAGKGAAGQRAAWPNGLDLSAWNLQTRSLSPRRKCAPYAEHIYVYPQAPHAPAHAGCVPAGVPVPGVPETPRPGASPVSATCPPWGGGASWLRAGSVPQMHLGPPWLPQFPFSPLVLTFLTPVLPASWSVAGSQEGTWGSGAVVRPCW